METKKTTKNTSTTKKPAAKKTTATKKVTTAKKPAASKKSAAAKKTTTTKKTTTAKKPTTVKKTTTARKTTTTRKAPAKKTPVVKNSEVTVEEVVAVLTGSKEEHKIEEPKSIEREIIIEEPIEEVIIEEPIEEEIIEEEPIEEEVRIERPIEYKEEKISVPETRKVPKKKIKVRPIFKLILLVILVCIAFFYSKKYFCNNDSYKDKATYTTAFFIKNNKGKYALYNDSGKKISDFIYDSANTFINNSVLVYKEKEGYAIINSKGKNVVPFGKYNYISSYAGVYKVRSDKGYKLLDSEGKTLIEAESLDVSSYGDDYPFNVVTANNEIKVISFDGTTIKTFKQNQSVKSPTVNHVGEYSTIYYNGTTVIFNSRTKKVITEYKKDVHFCVSAATEDGKVLILNSCTSWFETLPSVGHIISVNGKITDLSKKCNDLSIVGDTVICSTSTSQRFVDIKGKKATLGNDINSRTAFIDEDNYVTRDNKTFKLIFYKKGKAVKATDGQLASTGKVESKLYVVYTNNAYEYYNVEGKKAIDESFKYASSFDKNGLARVSKNGTTYYLINEKGKKISEEYIAISNYEDYYQVTNKKSFKGVIDEKGKEIVDVKYSTVNIKNIRDKFYAIVSTDTGKYAVYNLSNGKLIKEAKSSITINDHYIKVSGQNKTAYYTYKGKLIYEEK